MVIFKGEAIDRAVLAKRRNLRKLENEFSKKQINEGINEQMSVSTI